MWQYADCNAARKFHSWFELMQSECQPGNTRAAADLRRPSMGPTSGKADWGGCGGVVPTRWPPSMRFTHLPITRALPWPPVMQTSDSCKKFDGSPGSCLTNKAALPVVAAHAPKQSPHELHGKPIDNCEESSPFAPTCHSHRDCGDAGGLGASHAKLGALEWYAHPWEHPRILWVWPLSHMHQQFGLESERPRAVLKN